MSDVTAPKETDVRERILITAERLFRAFGWDRRNPEPRSKTTNPIDDPRARAQVLIQEPNTSSGGTPSEVAVDVFLAHSGRGPEHDALVQELAALGPG
jgi:hypothetical protein